MRRNSAQAASGSQGLWKRLSTPGPLVSRRREPDEFHAIDGDVRKQVPVHRIAERLVDAHAVLVDRKTLRGSQLGSINIDDNLDDPFQPDILYRGFEASGS